MPFDALSGSLEDNVLTLLAWHEHCAAEIALKVTPELYSTRVYQRIARVCANYLAQYGHPPRAHLRDLLEDDLRRSDEGKFLAQVLDAMDRLHDEMQPEYVLPELDRFISIRKLTLVVNRAADSLHAGDLDAAQEALGEAEYKADEKAGVYLKDTEAWLSFLDQDEEVEAFSSGIDILDERKVTPCRGSLFLILAATGVGKSYWLRQIAKHNLLMHKRKILHVTLENDLEETLEYYTMALLGRAKEDLANLRVTLFKRDALGRFVNLDFTQVAPDLMSPAQRQQIKRALAPIQKRGGELLVKWFPSGVLTLAMLSNYLDMLEKTQGFKPDMVIVDYLDEMQTDPNNPRISTINVTRGLRGLAGMRDLALVTATQANRSAADAKLVGSHMVGEAWAKIAIADVACTISRTQDEEDNNLARILVAKARRSKDKWIALITQAYATGQFCLDSVFFSKLAKSEVARVTGNEMEDEG